MKKRKSKKNLNLKQVQITIDLPGLIAKRFDPTIRSILGSMFVEIIEQFERQERMHCMGPEELGGKAIAMIESIKLEIATKFLGYPEDFRVRLEEAANLQLLQQTAIDAFRGEAKK